MRVYNGLSFDSEEDKKKLPKIMEKLDEFAIGKVNGTYETYVFNSRNQEADESINAYVAPLRKLAQTCNFCTCLHDNIIRDRIVLGVRSKQMRKRLLQERKLTLSKCIDICHEIGNHAVKFQIDCGASINIITEAILSSRRHLNSSYCGIKRELLRWKQREWFFEIQRIGRNTLSNLLS